MNKTELVSAEEAKKFPWVTPRMQVSTSQLTGAVLRALMLKRFESVDDSSYESVAAATGIPAYSFLPLMKSGEEIAEPAKITFAILALCDVAPEEFVDLCGKALSFYSEKHKAKAELVEILDKSLPCISWKGIRDAAVNLIYVGEKK